MSETAELATKTSITVQGSILDIFTYYDSSFTEFLQFFIVEILGMVGTTYFAEGELGYTVQGEPDFSANVNDHGELVVIDDNTDPYFVDNNGYLIYGDILIPPVGTAATAVSDVGFTANWNAVAGTVGYYLDVSKDPQFDTYLTGYRNKNMGLAVTEVMTGLSAGMNYYYRVRAYDTVQTSLDSNIVTTTTVTDVSTVMDKDGNVYNTITIGGLQIIAENLKTTHYADGTPILNIPDSASPNLLTGWTNIDFDTLVSSGANITSAIEGLGTYGHVKSNNVHLLAGDFIWYTIDLTLISGDLPWTQLYKNNVWSGVASLHTGVNNSGWLIMEEGDYAIGFQSYTAGGTNFSAVCSFVSTYTKGWLDNTAGAYCWYNNDITNKTPYGSLYNWGAVSNVHGLAYFERGGTQETGWRVTNEADWLAILAELVGGLVAGGKLKEIGLTHWTTPNVGATDEVGFAAVGAGFRHGDYPGAFEGFNLSCYFWCKDINKAVNLQYDNTIASIYSSLVHSGFSVRCVRDI